MAPLVGPAAGALLVLTSLFGTATAIPYGRMDDCKTAPFANTTSHFPLSAARTSEIQTTSQSSADPSALVGTETPAPRDLQTSTFQETDTQSATLTDDIPSSIISATDKQIVESSTAVQLTETSIVYVTRTVELIGGSGCNPATSQDFLTSTQNSSPSASIEIVAPTSGIPGTFIVGVTSTVALDIAGSATATSTLQPSSSATGTPVTSVTVTTDLETRGVVTSKPYPTDNKTMTADVSPSALSRTASVPVPEVGNTTATGSVDPFAPIATGAPAAQIPATGNHPQPTNNIVAQKTPLHTNKFYSNLFLGSEGSSVFTHPYSLSWANGSGVTGSYGLAVQHVDASQRAFGPNNTNLPGTPASYFINPLGYQTLVLSAKELVQQTQLTVDSLDTFSATANLFPYKSPSSSIRFPLVQGMGFFTGIYSNLQPQIQTGIFFASVTSLGNVGNNVYKWRLSMNDGSSWLLYAYSNSTASPTFTLVSNALLQGPTNWSGTIQIAKNPAGAAGEAVYDKSAGVYPVSARITGGVAGKVGQYSLTWAVGGKNAATQPALQYALPHHVQSFDATTAAKLQKNLTLQTTTKGVATAIVSNSWTLTESNLPTDMGFAPWSPTSGTKLTYSSTAVNAMYKAAQLELAQNISSQTDLDSMYYSGKALSKFASIVYTVSSIVNEPTLAQQGLQTLEKAFNVFTSNKQQYPLFYDTVWKGIVSSAAYNGGNPLADFGNTFYNDHHFHYGYFLHAAAIVGSLDPSWLAANKDWVNSLARDVDNPSAQDAYFPVFRSFDWYHGHSWAKGLFESGDSKDEESSSEDVMFSYGLKMWGHVVGDRAMEARGNLMLAVQARSLHNYFLMEHDNANQPAQFIANKATGIMFENKIDHTTYFGANLEYVQGIHMLPLVPASALTRRAQFVQEEWDAFFRPGAYTDARNVTGGWKGILYANLALVDPVTSFNFFNQDNFDNSWLDGGASKTWYLAYAAGLGGA